MEYIQANYYKITKVVNGECPYNYKCHIVSVQNAIKNKGWKIYGIYQVAKDDKYIITHFVNHNGKNYIEMTEWWVGITFYDYYVVKEFKIEEFDRADAPLSAMKKAIFEIWYTNKFLNWLFRLKAFDIF